jgi:hypothetical protein
MLGGVTSVADAADVLLWPHVEWEPADTIPTSLPGTAIGTAP